ncbi:hypothetical protein TNCV_4911141 [Trichonephila clavipes]|nr:hypothetical protein TNCV_4911141 [Trichonephila clavipes]
MSAGIFILKQERAIVLARGSRGRGIQVVKSLVYADKPQTLAHLEDNIRRVIADIRPQMLGKVIENWTSRLDYIRASRGSPVPEIIFKIADWKYTRIYKPQRRLRVLVEKCRKDSSHMCHRIVCLSNRLHSRFDCEKMILKSSWHQCSINRFLLVGLF